MVNRLLIRNPQQVTEEPYKEDSGQERMLLWSKQPFAAGHRFVVVVADNGGMLRHPLGP